MEHISDTIRRLDPQEEIKPLLVTAMIVALGILLSVSFWIVIAATTIGIGYYLYQQGTSSGEGLLILNQYKMSEIALYMEAEEIENKTKVQLLHYLEGRKEKGDGLYSRRELIDLITNRAATGLNKFFIFGIFLKMMIVLELFFGTLGFIKYGSGNYGLWSVPIFIGLLILVGYMIIESTGPFEWLREKRNEIKEKSIENTPTEELIETILHYPLMHHDNSYRILDSLAKTRKGWAFERYGNCP